MTHDMCKGRHWKIWRKRNLFCMLGVLPSAMFFYVMHKNYLIYNIVNYDVEHDTSDIMTCHYDTKEGLLQVVDNNFHPSEKAIFFHETTCSGILTERQACSVESAAVNHPEWEIYVFFSATSSIRTFNIYMLQLLKYKNVKFYRIYLKDYAKGTPIEPLIKRGNLNGSQWKVVHTSDVLRFITLYKWSGIYIDLDMILVKPLEMLAKNFIGRENQEFLGSGIVAFSSNKVGRQVAADCIKDMNENYNPDIWGQAQAVLTRVIKNLCTGVEDIVEMNYITCSGFEVYPPKYFFPIQSDKILTYFKKGVEYFPSKKAIRNAYAFHLFNKLSWSIPTESGSFYEKLSKKFCPVVYSTNNA